MKVKCECGRKFEVPPGAQSAKCPGCGRKVQVPASDDWLLAMDVDSISLETEQPAPTPTEGQAGRPAPTAPQGPGPVPVQPRQAAEGTPKPRPAGAGPRVPPQGGRGALGVGSRADAMMKPREAGPPPERLLGLMKRLKEDPKACLPYFEAGIKGKPFIVELAGAFVGLALLGAIAQTLLMTRGLVVKLAVGYWLFAIVEMAASGVLFSLLSVLFKRDAKPLGICEAVAATRMGSFLAMVPVAVIMGLAVVLTHGSEGTLTTVLNWILLRLPYLYILMALAGQMFLVLGLLKLGCWPTVVLNIVMTFASWTLADNVRKFFAG
jgi:hypothetical protein